MTEIIPSWSWTRNKIELQEIARQIDKSIILTTKDSWVWKTIAWILFVISFGKLSRNKFLCDFATTIGPIQAYPKEWTTYNVRWVIIHESRHTKQARWFGFGISPWIGIIPMSLFYIFLPLPIKLAYFRFILEVDAECCYWEKIYQEMNKETRAEELLIKANWWIEIISGAEYIWPWPKSLIRKKVYKEVERIIAKYQEE